ncbi:MAG: glycosyltransferase family 9 protein [Hymenobacter sp.]
MKASATSSSRRSKTRGRCPSPGPPSPTARIISQQTRQCSVAQSAHSRTAAGAIRLHQSASLLRQAQFVVSHDTGLMHIAAAFKKEIFRRVAATGACRVGMYPTRAAVQGPGGTEPELSPRAPKLASRNVHRAISSA